MQTIDDAISAGDEYQRLRAQWIEEKERRQNARDVAFMAHKTAYNKVKLRLMDNGKTGVYAETAAQLSVAGLEDTLLERESQLARAKDEVSYCRDGLDFTRSKISGIKEEMGLAR